MGGLGADAAEDVAADGEAARRSGSAPQRSHEFCPSSRPLSCSAAPTARSDAIRVAIAEFDPSAPSSSSSKSEPPRVFFVFSLAGGPFDGPPPPDPTRTLGSSRPRAAPAGRLPTPAATLRRGSSTRRRLWRVCARAGPLNELAGGDGAFGLATARRRRARAPARHSLAVQLERLEPPGTRHRSGRGRCRRWARPGTGAAGQRRRRPGDASGALGGGRRRPDRLRARRTARRDARRAAAGLLPFAAGLEFPLRPGLDAARRRRSRAASARRP